RPDRARCPGREGDRERKGRERHHVELHLGNPLCDRRQGGFFGCTTTVECAVPAGSLLAMSSARTQPGEPIGKRSLARAASMRAAGAPPRRGVVVVRGWMRVCRGGGSVRWRQSRGGGGGGGAGEGATGGGARAGRRNRRREPGWRRVIAVLAFSRT